MFLNKARRGWWWQRSLAHCSREKLFSASCLPLRTSGQIPGLDPGFHYWVGQRLWLDVSLDYMFFFFFFSHASKNSRTQRNTPPLEMHIHRYLWAKSPEYCWEYHTFAPDWIITIIITGCCFYFLFIFFFVCDCDCEVAIFRITFTSSHIHSVVSATFSDILKM